MPLYRLLKKSKNFVWTDEADAALQQLKKTLSEAPVLAAPKEEEPMLLYLTATTRVISVAIVVERKKDETQEYPEQYPVYYLSEVFSARVSNTPYGTQ